MSLIRVDVETIVVGGGPIASLVVLKPRNGASGAASRIPRVPSAPDGLVEAVVREERPVPPHPIAELISAFAHGLGALWRAIAGPPARNVARMFVFVDRSCVSGT